jgi:hypothetical protein
LILKGEDKRIVNVSSGAARDSPPFDFSQVVTLLIYIVELSEKID